jgi:WD40 repeat protein
MTFFLHLLDSQAPAEFGGINPARARLVRTCTHNSPFFSCRFDPTGRFIFAGAQDNTIQRWEVETGNKTSLVGHRSWIRALAFVRWENTLISGDYNGKLIWWPADVANPQPVRTVDAHQGWVRAVAVSPDGRWLASCGNDHLVKLWSPRDGTLLREFHGHESHVYNVAFHPRLPFIISGDLHGHLKQWDIHQGREVREFDGTVLHRYDTTFRADHGGIRSMAFNADGSLLACAGITNVTNAFAGIGNAAVVLFDWPTGRRLRVLRTRENFRGTAWGVAFHPAGFLVGAGGGNGGALWFWRPGEEQSFATVTVPNNVRDLALHPDGRRLAVACFDNVVRIYDMG